VKACAPREAWTFCSRASDELAADGADLGHAAGIVLPEGATDGHDVRQSGEPREAAQERIVPIVAGVAELAKSEEQVHDEQQDDEMVAKDRGDVQVAEARAQPVLELQAAQKEARCDSALAS
jgi:hypothetical protein